MTAASLNVLTLSKRARYSKLRGGLEDSGPRVKVNVLLASAAVTMQGLWWL
jgi:hypothetical protein